MIFFFKQKTAYDMRISDWSSDVCSSDLTGRHGILERRFQHNASVDDLHRHLELVVQPDVPLAEFRPGRRDLLFPLRRGLLIEGLIMNLRLLDPVEHIVEHRRKQVDGDDLGQRLRSEEHKSELQSLMRISYAVFCLKTKKKQVTD